MYENIQTSFFHGGKDSENEMVLISWEMIEQIMAHEHDRILLYFKK